MVVVMEAVLVAVSAVREELEGLFIVWLCLDVVSRKSLRELLIMVVGSSWSCRSKYGFW